MAGLRSFKELLIRQRARAWSKAIFAATRRAPFSKDQLLALQINNSSESVMSNIAGEFGRGTQTEYCVLPTASSVAGIGGLGEERSLWGGQCDGLER